MTDIVVLFADKWNISPFEVMERDIDDFFLIANSIINKNNSANKAVKHKQVKSSKNDGFWDF